MPLYTASAAAAAKGEVRGPHVTAVSRCAVRRRQGCTIVWPIQSWGEGLHGCKVLRLLLYRGSRRGTARCMAAGCLHTHSRPVGCHVC